jgi:arylesterase / paraoxonase
MSDVPRVLATRPLPLPQAGAEDVAIDRETGLAYVSCYDRRRKPERGAIYVVDLNDPERPAVDATAGFDKLHHPHGIGLHAGPNGRRLFVVHHMPGKQEAIEIFDVDGERLNHRTTVPDPSGLMHSPNDIFPVGEEAFYVTNLLGSRSLFGNMWEATTRRSWSYVLYYDGESFRKVADGLTMANGVAASPDGRFLYVATTLRGAVHVYRRSPDGSLTPAAVVPAGSGLDNIELDAQGNLWIGAHPNLAAFMRYAVLRIGRAPSQVLRFRCEDGLPAEPEEVFRDSGHRLPASSVAAVFGETMLVGSVFDGVLHCTLDRPV